MLKEHKDGSDVLNTIKAYTNYKKISLSSQKKTITEYVNNDARYWK